MSKYNYAPAVAKLVRQAITAKDSQTAAATLTHDLTAGLALLIAAIDNPKAREEHVKVINYEIVRYISLIDDKLKDVRNSTYEA